MSITLGDLTPKDQGRKVTITSNHATITGILTAFDVRSDWITESRLGQNPEDWEQTPGRRTMDISVGSWSTSGLPLDTPVEVER